MFLHVKFKNIIYNKLCKLVVSEHVNIYNKK